MHQSFESPAPLGLGNSGAFNFKFLKPRFEFLGVNGNKDHKSNY